MARNQDASISMLHHFLEHMRGDNRKQVVHCLVTVSRLSPRLADKRDVGLHYEKVFQICQSKFQGEGPTGVLLVYPQHCLHLMEGPWELINAVLADLHTMDSKGDMLTGSKVISFSPNISQRLFPQWAKRVLNLPALSKGDVYQTSDSIHVTVGSSLDNLYKLGVHLSKLTQHQLKATMDSLTSKLPHLLLQQDVMEYYLGCSLLNTPSKFLEHYSNPPSVVLDSELVWPMPLRLFPYDQ